MSPRAAVLLRPNVWLRRALAATFLAVALHGLAASAAAGAATSRVLDRASAYMFATTWVECEFCPYVETCERVNAARVDCLLAEYNRRPKVCDVMVAVRLSGRGYVHYMPYDCMGSVDIEAQIQLRPTDSRFWPITPAATVYGDWPFEVGQRTRYGRTRWLGKNRFPVRFYTGRTSQHREPSVRRFERIGGATTFFDIWVTPAGEFLPGSYVPGTLFCDVARDSATDGSFYLAGSRVAPDGSFAARPESGQGLLRGRVHPDYVAGHFRVRDQINGRDCTLPRGRVLFKGPRKHAYPRRAIL